ncbi:amino acid adenylation domain-containing protein [Nostoc sp. C117]|uniref:non-ribosomal peptide synthetase n=1 Tax=Nostoc sp. C117 TaxID=3349875 RepID=UPI00370D543A
MSLEQDILKIKSQLSPAKQALLAKRLQGKVQSDQKLNVVPRRTTISPVPLSFAQERLWFLHKLNPDSAFYNEHGAIQLQGVLDVDILEQCLRELVSRHESLRTTFDTVVGQPVQVIAASMDVPLSVVNLSELPQAAQKLEILRLSAEQCLPPFNFVQGPLLRWTLVQLGKQDYVLLLTMHHIIIDGWSLGVIFRELAVLYAAFSQGKPYPLLELPLQYADFALWQRQWLQGSVLESQLTYWKQQLSNYPPVLQLPTDYPRPSVQTFRGARQYFSLGANLTQALKDLSKQENLTLFITLLAAFKTLLYRYTSVEKIVIGSPIANRNRDKNTEGIVGFFANTIAMQTDFSGNPTFRELLSRVRQMVLEAQTYQDLPFEQLVKELQPHRDLSHAPIFQVLFLLQNELTSALSALEPLGLNTSLWETDTNTAKFDLTLAVRETDGKLIGAWEYNTDLFAPSTIARMANHFQTLLAAIVLNADRRLHDLPLLTMQEKQQFLEWNQTQLNYSKNLCIHHLFEQQVQKTPNAVAVVFKDEQLTYRELNSRANQLAHHLQTLGVSPEVLVGTCVERSLEMIVGLLAILKAGGAYVPLDSAYPQERLFYMLSDSQVKVLLTTEKLAAKLPEHKASVVYLDTDSKLISQQNQYNPITNTKPTNLAYVLYTSGSTGKPKGVTVEHRSTINFLHWAREVYTSEQLAGVLACTSINFDLSVFELFVPLCWGGRVILVENALYLPTLPAVLNVTLLNTVPSVIAELLKINGIPDGVKTINLAGEPLPHQLVQQLYQHHPSIQVFNLYGPTEATTYSTFTLVPFGLNKAPNIGRPIANTQVYILDSHLQPVPIGVMGELYIGGAGLARDYLHRPELTADKFIRNPFSDILGDRLYKTGDRARFLPDGNIEFLGRIDHQIKIRGYRIELGEIEAVLVTHPKIKEAVVLAKEDQLGEKRLLAYVVADNKASEILNQEKVVTISELRNFLKEKLPEYMMPSAFVFLQTMPLTPNGKIDHRALPVPESRQLEKTYVRPQTQAERLLTNIWQQVLQIEKVGVEDNFFHLGGHSLLIIKVQAKINEIFAQEIPIVELFKYSTIKSLAEFLTQNNNELTYSQQANEKVENRNSRKAMTIQKRQIRQQHRANNQ